MLRDFRKFAGDFGFEEQTLLDNQIPEQMQKISRECVTRRPQGPSLGVCCKVNVASSGTWLSTAIQVTLLWYFFRMLGFPGNLNPATSINLGPFGAHGFIVLSRHPPHPISRFPVGTNYGQTWQIVLIHRSITGIIFEEQTQSMVKVEEMCALVFANTTTVMIDQILQNTTISCPAGSTADFREYLIA